MFSFYKILSQFICLLDSGNFTLINSQDRYTLVFKMPNDENVIYHNLLITGVLESFSKVILDYKTECDVYNSICDDIYLHVSTLLTKGLLDDHYSSLHTNVLKHLVSSTYYPVQRKENVLLNSLEGKPLKRKRN